MSEAAAGKRQFIDLWSDASILCDSKIQDRKTDTQMPFSSKSPVCKDVQSPKSRGCSRYPGWNNADSPGDAEPSQDIFWDPTSPTPANTGRRNTRVVEISDIVNRIAPKDMKQRGAESPLLQWIGDNAVPSTPDVPRPRVQRKSSRQSSVDDLVKLARQFDRNMQRDSENAREPSIDGHDLGNTTETPFPGNVKDPKCPSSSERAEAELNALFDCSTQKSSVRLSLGSSASADSQEVRTRPATSSVVASQQAQLESAGRSDRGAVHYDDFDDDWENDDLLDDSFVLALTQNPERKHDAAPEATSQVNAKTDATRFTSVCKPVSKPSCSTLQDLCFKRKTSNRRTFTLEPRTDASFAGTQPKNSATSKALSSPQPGKMAGGLEEASAAADAVKDISDSLWDDGNDDALLYQVCDSVERTSNTQPQLHRPGNCQEKRDTAGGAQRGTSPAWATDAGAWRCNRLHFPSHLCSVSFHISDLSVSSSVVFVTSQTAGKCSATEIERKKQEALARRRQRMQNVQKS
ncbi:ewing's tumor-associated antigen 1 [Brachionichthys hirsutus]|uniref:ewing's tumor-associated antigen 1 n=1 Tax=Brachionichthys hirsutus TaxID=412623 RepID=UPI0036046235